MSQSIDLTAYYREVLRSELDRRRGSNPRYSLRAFARQLGLDPAQLSRVMAGSANLSVGNAAAVATLVTKTPTERELFVASVEYCVAKKPSVRAAALQRLSRVVGKKRSVNLSEDAMLAISEWHHVAILDLTSLENFSSRPSWIAKYLGIQESTAKQAIDRLLRLGLLTQRGSRLLKANAQLASPTDVPNLGIRNFHRQMIAKAGESLDQQAVDRRYVVGKTMAIARADLPRIKVLVERFMSDVNDIIYTDTPKDALYQLNVQLFDLSKGSDP